MARLFEQSIEAIFQPDEAAPAPRPAGTLDA
jgi:hypothetical protein